MALGQGRIATPRLEILREDGAAGEIPLRRRGSVREFADVGLTRSAS
ncbi:hypothetical protein H4696_008945 [Amycolatopsis lexingtonensis]|uniref:Uncharacterized protein n=1 Tax=Amycolatopsis lexingtonensis TaxID=218822 RepID=A0ABR9IFA4_9PSEU|nr:hypothetical protein [Amycolatopsis lexingtonensis]MBE1501845.1 hypothetical protein [Amycolatopsis lexingtonensis]